jgi:transcriptional regulator with XRE-family HTH domain
MSASHMQPLTVAATLHRYRLAAGYTQEELAERAGISARSISDIERGVSKIPHADTMDGLADALGLSPEERATLHAAARAHRSLGTQSAHGD